MPSNHLILCRLLLLLPSIFPSIRVLSNESGLCIRRPKYWSFSFSIIPSNEHPGLISFRRNWLDLLAVQGALKSLLQHHSSKASILRYSAFFIVQLSPGFKPWFGKIFRRRKWQPIPVFLPGKPHGQRSLAGCSSWGHKELDMTEAKKGLSMVFPVVMYGCESWTVKKAEHRRIDTFELWCC